MSVRMFKVDSSNIEAIGYDSVNEILHVTFSRNAHYIYKGVPKNVFSDVMTADSHGKYLNSNVKGTYQYEKSNPPMSNSASSK